MCYKFFHHPNDRTLIRTKVKSKMVASSSHHVFLKFDPAQTGANGIVQRYCNCKPGARTFGVCSHIASVVWFIGNISRVGKASNRKSFLSFIQHAKWRCKVTEATNDPAPA